METLTFVIDSTNNKYTYENFDSLSFNIPFSRYFKDSTQMYKLRTEFISTSITSSEYNKLFIQIAGITNYNKFDTRGNKGNTLLLGVAKPNPNLTLNYYNYTMNESICHKLQAPQNDTIEIKIYIIQNSSLTSLDYQLILHFDPC